MEEQQAGAAEGASSTPERLLEAIRREGRREGYTITLLAGDGAPAVAAASLEHLGTGGERRGGEQAAAQTPAGSTAHSGRGQRLRWDRARMLASGALALLAFAAEMAAGRVFTAIPSASPAALPTWLPIALYGLAAAIGGWGNFRKAYLSIPRLDLDMSVLMSLAVIGAVVIGEWREAAVVAVLYSVSEWLEASTLERARRSLRELMTAAPRVARIRRPAGGADGGAGDGAGGGASGGPGGGVEGGAGGGPVEVDLPVESVQIGDLMIVRPGEKLAMDGRIVRGRSALNEQAITGESVPAEKGPGDEVYAGTLNTYGPLEVEVTRRVEETAITRIIYMVEEAQAQRAPSQAFVDRFAAVYTPAVLVLAVGTALVPPLLGGAPWGPWVYRGLALLVVACPCALVVSTPVAVVSAIANAARSGVLIKGGIHLEQAGALRAVAFDKTGTLTEGRPELTDAVALAGGTPEELLRLAASLEAHSEHPLARAVVEAARSRGIAFAPAAGVAAVAGSGVRGEVDGRSLFAGSLQWFGGALPESNGAIGPAAVLDPEAMALAERLQSEGKTVVLVGEGSGHGARALGVLALADRVRPSSRAAVAALKRAGIRATVLLTGDNEATARAVATGAGVDRWRAGLLPGQKLEAVRELIRVHGNVAMVGDGINDAPALAAATVGIAMGGAGTDAALETADVVLMADDLSKLPFVIRLGRRALRVIQQNIAFSLAIKLIAVLAVFPGWLTLWLAILGDMGASILVTLNGMRLLGVRPEER